MRDGKEVEVASRRARQYTTEIIVSIEIMVNLIKRSKITHQFRGYDYFCYLYEINLFYISRFVEP